MKNLTPFVPTANETFTIDTSTYTPNPVRGVVILNNSGFVLTLSYGGSDYTIPAGMNDYITLVPISGAIFDGEVGPVNALISQNNPQVSGVIYELNDKDPIGYPMVNPAFQAEIASAQITTILDFNVNAGQHATRSVSIPGYVQGITMYIKVDLGASCAFSVTGGFTGYEYWGDLYRAPDNSIQLPPIYITIDPIKDTSITFDMDNSGGTGQFHLHAIGSALPPPIISNTDQYVTFEAFSSVAGSGTTVVLLQPPSSFGDGLEWEVQLLEVNAGTTVASVAAAAYIEGTTSLAILLGSYSQVAGIFETAVGTFRSSEGLSVHNSTPGNASATAVARLRTIGTP